MKERIAAGLLLGVLALGLLLRLAAVWRLTEAATPEGDIQYDLYAASLVAGKGFVIDELAARGTERPARFQLDRLYSFKPPLYPLFLAALYATCGRNYVIVGVAQALVGVATCFLLFVTGSRLFDRITGLTAAALLAVYPYHVVTCARVSDTTLFTFLLAAAVGLTYRAGRRTTAGSCLLAGAATGLGILCRSNLIAFIPFQVAWLLLRKRAPVGRRVGHATAFAAAAALCLLPWSVRNYRIHGQPVLLGTNGGYTLWQAHNPFTEKYLRMGSDLDPIAFSEDIDWEARGLTDLTEAQQDQWFYREALRFLRAHPVGAVKLAGLKFVGLWGWRLYPASPGRAKNALYTLSYGPILVLGLIGLVVLRRRWPDTSLVLLLFASFSLLYMLFYGKTIYRTPLDPMLCLLAAGPLTAAGVWWAGRAGPPRRADTNSSTGRAP